MNSASYGQDPDAVLDYTVDWGLWLPADDTISASTWTSSSVNMTLSNDDFDDTTTSVFVTIGASAEEDDIYQAVNHITTVGGRENDQTLYIKVVTG